MTIEINETNRDAALQSAKRSLEWEEKQLKIVEDLNSPAHSLFGIPGMLYHKVSGLRSIIKALESHHNITLTGEEAKSIGLI